MTGKDTHNTPLDERHDSIREGRFTSTEVSLANHSDELSGMDLLSPSLYASRTAASHWRRGCGKQSPEAAS